MPVSDAGSCPKCRHTLKDGAKLCAHCGWGDPERIAIGKRWRLEGCLMMVAAMLSCGGGCAAISSFSITGELWLLILIVAVVVGTVGLVKWWRGLGIYDGK